MSENFVKKNLASIVAISSNAVIGDNNQLLWHFPADLKHFRKTTIGGTILMGRRTYESIGRKLPDRRNIIISRDQNYKAQGCECVTSISAALEKLACDEKAFVIGGGEIYAATLSFCHDLYMTVIEHVYQGDTYFPKVDWCDWRLVSCEHHAADDKHAYPYRFLHWSR